MPRASRPLRKLFKGIVHSEPDSHIPTEPRECSPLLPHDATKFPRIEVEFATSDEEIEREPKFPTAQLCVLALVRIIEPITFTSVLPYIYAQTVHLLSKGSSNESSIALYSALLISSFAFSETLTSHVWGRLSDTYGRKPIILIGLAGSAISLLLYGFSTNIPLAMTARIIGGLLNGNVGVLQTAVMELTGAREDWRARGQLVLPFVWCLGSIIGPAIGGGLSPSAPSAGSLVGVFGLPSQGAWERYPYALPNVFCALVAALGMLVGWLLMEETNLRVKDSKQTPNDGLAIGRCILNGPRELLLRIMKLCDYTSCRSAPVTVQYGEPEPSKETLEGAFEHDDAASCCETTALTTANPSSSTAMYQSLAAIDSCTSLPSQLHSHSTSPTKSIYTPRFYLLMTTFFILYYHTTAFEHLLAIFLQSRLPALFPTPGKAPLGEGFGFTTRTMGVLFLVQGVFQMSIQFVAFPFLSRRFSNMGIYIATLAIYPLFYFLMPLLVLLPPSSLMFWACLSLLLTVKVVLEITSYPALFMVLYDFAADSPGAMGGVYGLSAAVAGAAKGMGPVMTGAVWKVGMNGGGVGIGWWFLSVLSVVGVGIAAHLRVSSGKKVDVVA